MNNTNNQPAIATIFGPTGGFLKSTEKLLLPISIFTLQYTYRL